MGRRPARKAVSLQEVYDTIFPPQHSMEPFPAAFAKLLNGRSQRSFAAKIPINQSALSRFLSGERKPDLLMLERIAAAAKVSPGYFVEYRAAYVGKLVERVLLAHPNVSIGAHRNVAQFRKQFEAAS